MPFVRFLRDYQGTVTNNVYYTAGTVVDLPGRMSYALRTEGVVEKVAPLETGKVAATLPAAFPAVSHKPAAKKYTTKRAAKKTTKGR
jgi:hypothetical protein